MFLALALQVKAQESSGDWPMFRANIMHTGEGTGSPVLSPKLLWINRKGLKAWRSVK
jgi:hypothetical protein